MLSGQSGKVDAMVTSVESDGEAVMRKAFSVQASVGAGSAHQLDGASLQHAGADAAKDIAFADPVEDDVVDAGSGQELAQQQA